MSNIVIPAGRRGNQGEKGNIELVEAGETIISYFFVRISGNTAFIYTPIEQFYNQVVGVSLTSANVSEFIKIQTSGLLDVPFPVTLNQTYYVSSNGQFTTTVPTNGIYQEIGYGVDNNKIFLNFKQPILLI